LAGACAKKLPPPSPDRFPPRLAGIVTRTRTQLEVEFDEPIEPASANPESLVVTGPGGERFAVRGVSRGRGDSRLLVWTPALPPGVYEIRGRAADRDGNFARFHGRFRASTRVDTVAPRVAGLEPRPGADRVRFGPRLNIRFSEAVDTAAGVPWFLLPAGEDTLFRTSWAKDWQSLGLGYRDSLDTGRLYFLVVPTGWRDLEENRARAVAVTFFSTDSAPDLATVAGRVVIPGDTLVRGGLVLIEADRTAGAAAVGPDGRFALRLRPGSYSALALADTSGDGVVDLKSPVLPFSAPAESLELELAPATEALGFDAYRR
jgi:hypothetical protein